MAREPSKYANRYVLLTTMFCLSLPACLDVFLSFVCVRFPLPFYLAAGASGVFLGVKIKDWLSAGGLFRAVVQIVAIMVCFMGFLCAGVLSASAPNWHTKCSWSYCGEALSFSLLHSPFPVGTPDCSALHMCANEARLNTSQDTELRRLIKVQGCAEL